jgi:predicted enzyme related to lactoylglutathione lyase
MSATTRRPVTAVLFEIPVRDLPQAIPLCERVFETTLERASIDGLEMALFPDSTGVGASGALWRGETYVPSRNGTWVSLQVKSAEATLSRAVAAGGRLLSPVKQVIAQAVVAEYEDLEGHRVGLLERR